MDEKMRMHLLNLGIIPEDVERMAEEVMEEYVAARRALAPEYRTRNENLVYFEKAALHVLQHDTSAKEWISAQFRSEWVPNPSQIQGRVAESKFHEAQASRMDDAGLISLHISTYANTYDRLTSSGKPVREALLEQKDNFGPIFLWCIASSLGMSELAGEEAREARILLRRTPYLSVYQKAFPFLAKQLEELSA